MRNVSNSLLVIGSQAVRAETLRITSFNVQFRGNSPVRNNVALALILEPYDNLMIKELVSFPIPKTPP